MRILIIAGILALLASTAHALSDSQLSNVDIVGSGSGDLNIISASATDLKMDIVGSLAEDIKIVTAGKVKDLELVGSHAGNITIVSGVKQGSSRKCYRCVPHCRPLYYGIGPNCGELDCCPCPPPCPPEDNGTHMGVDAWHGNYWFASKKNMPKWPHIFGGA